MMGLGAAGAMAGAMLAVVLVSVLVFYVYFAFVMMTICKKLKYDKWWLAWIPFANLALFPILAKGKQKYWPWVFIFIVPIANLVFYIIWTWKIFERRKYPGWLSLIVLLSFVPILNMIAGVANLVIWGLVAWVDRR